MATIIASCIRALLDRFIDYSGMFPPAGSSCDVEIANYKGYRKEEHALMLRWLVIPAAELEHVPPDLHGSLALLSDADESRAAVIEAKRIVRTRRPAYCEVSLGELDEVRRAGCFAKFRTGGVDPDAIPSICRLRRIYCGMCGAATPFQGNSWIAPFGPGGAPAHL